MKQDPYILTPTWSEKQMEQIQGELENELRKQIAAAQCNCKVGEKDRSSLSAFAPGSAVRKESKDGRFEGRARKKRCCGAGGHWPGSCSCACFLPSCWPAGCCCANACTSECEQGTCMQRRGEERTQGQGFHPPATTNFKNLWINFLKKNTDG